MISQAQISGKQILDGQNRCTIKENSPLCVQRCQIFAYKLRKSEIKYALFHLQGDKITGSIAQPKKL